MALLWHKQIQPLGSPTQWAGRNESPIGNHVIDISNINEKHLLGHIQLNGED